MIQRIQSIYLFLVIIFSGILGLFIPFWSLDTETNQTLIDMLNTKNLYQIIMGVTFLMIGFLSFISLLLYKKRIQQIRINLISIILNLLLFGLLLFYLLSLSGEWKHSMKGIGIWIPWVSIGLLLLANRAIQKDENLVKSVDRIR